MSLTNGDARLHGLGGGPFWDGHNVLIEGQGYKFRLDGSPLPPDNTNISKECREATCKRTSFRLMLVKPLPDRPLERINLHLSNHPLGGAANRLFAALKVVEHQNQQLMVFPQLKPFTSFAKSIQLTKGSEFIRFFTEICEGLEFMHRHDVACGWTERCIMVDSSGMDVNKLESHRGRITFNHKSNPPSYYFIDLGAIPQLTPSDAATEHSREEHCIQCRQHIDCLGRLVWENFMKNSRYNNALKDMQTLLQNMIDNRVGIQIQDVQTSFDEIRRRRKIPDELLDPDVPTGLQKVWMKISRAMSRRKL